MLARGRASIHLRAGQTSSTQRYKNCIIAYDCTNLQPYAIIQVCIVAYGCICAQPYAIIQVCCVASAYFCIVAYNGAGWQPYATIQIYIVAYSCRLMQPYATIQICMVAHCRADLQTYAAKQDCGRHTALTETRHTCRAHPQAAWAVGGNGGSGWARRGWDSAVLGGV